MIQFQARIEGDWDTEDEKWKKGFNFQLDIFRRKDSTEAEYKLAKLLEKICLDTLQHVFCQGYTMTITRLGEEEG